MVDAHTADTLKVGHLYCWPCRILSNRWVKVPCGLLTTLVPLQAINTFLGKTDGRDKLCATIQVRRSQLDTELFMLRLWLGTSICHRMN